MSFRTRGMWPGDMTQGILGPAVPGQVRLALMALPIAAHSSGPPKRRVSSPVADPELPDPVVVAPPADPLDDPVVAVPEPVPAVEETAAVAVVPVSKEAPTKAAITAERITNCCLSGRPVSDACASVREVYGPRGDMYHDQEGLRFTS